MSVVSVVVARAVSITAMARPRTRSGGGGLKNTLRRRAGDIAGGSPDFVPAIRVTTISMPV